MFAVFPLILLSRYQTKCPRCGLFNPDTAQKCDCAYDFETRTVKSAYVKQKLPLEFFEPFALWPGWVSLITGCLVLFARSRGGLVLARISDLAVVP